MSYIGHCSSSRRIDDSLCVSGIVRKSPTELLAEMAPRFEGIPNLAQTSKHTTTSYTLDPRLMHEARSARASTTPVSSRVHCPLSECPWHDSCASAMFAHGRQMHVGYNWSCPIPECRRQPAVNEMTWLFEHLEEVHRIDSPYTT